MTLYVGSEKIRDRSSKGLYVGSSSIIKAYLGSELVYQFQSYNPSTVLSTVTNGNTYSTTLPRGVYQLHITGGGGSYSAWAYSGYPWAAGGGSGATWEGTFYLSQSTAFVMFGAAAKATSYMNLGGTRMITAGNGGGGGTGGGGAGGTLTVADDFTNNYMISATKSTNGNKGGGVTSGGSQKGGTSTSSNKWGGGTVLQNSAVQYGGAKLWYLRYNR